MLQSETSVCDLVLEHPECAEVLYRHAIDCCHEGRWSVAACCEARSMDLAEVTRELELAIARRSAPLIDPETASTRDLITRVIARHHQYLYRNLPFLRGLSAAVATQHGGRGHGLAALARAVAKIADVLFEHLQDEERHLFREILADPASPRVAEALGRMQHDHDEVETLLHDLRRLAASYEPPAWACTGYRTLMRELAVLESDTARHLHIENEVLRRRLVG